MDALDKQIGLLLKDYDIDVILDMCDITAEDTLRILVEGGHIELPDWTPKW